MCVCGGCVCFLFFCLINVFATACFSVMLFSVRFQFSIDVNTIDRIHKNLQFLDWTFTRFLLES